MRKNSFLKASWFLSMNAALLVVLACSMSFGQAGSSSVRGIITDPQGLSVAGATVTLTNTERNFSRTQTTGDEGTYLFSSIPPGTYQLSVELHGFKKASITDVQALVDTPTSVDVRLEVGNVTETVLASERK